MDDKDSVYYYNDSSSDGAEEPVRMSRRPGKAHREVSPEKKPQPVKAADTETKSGSVIAIILVSVLAMALLGSVVYTFDQRNRIYNKVAELNNELTMAEAENIRLQTEIDSKMSAKNVEEYAKNVLGMQKIDSSQIKYIKIQSDDVVNIPEQEPTFIQKVKIFFDDCVEYFRG